MGLFDALSVSGSGLSAERLRMDVTAENLANAQTTRTANGGPYRRKVVTLQEAGGGFDTALAAASSVQSGSAPGGVEVAGIAEDTTPDRMVYDPGHPDADAQGYVTLPNVNPVTEMVDLITSSRGYEANVQALNASKQMFTRTLDLLR